MSAKFYQERGDRNYIRAQRAWIIIAPYVMFRMNECEWGQGLITYGRLAQHMGYTEKSGVTLNKVLGIIGMFCQDNQIPVLNMMVINQESGEPSHLMFSEGRKTLRAEQNAVMKYDWFSVRPPSAGTLKRYTTSGD